MGFFFFWIGIHPMQGWTATTSHGVTRKEAQNFDDEPRVQENQQVKDQQSCTSVFVSSVTNPSGNWGHQPRRYNSIPYMGVWKIYRDTEQPQEKETS